MEDLDVTIDLKTAYACEKLYSRLAWQKIFNIYRATGGDLDKMDNMLCDLYSLEDNIKSGSFTLYWHFCHEYTVLLGFVDPSETCYKIEYDADEMTITIERA